MYALIIAIADHKSNGFIELGGACELMTNGGQRGSPCRSCWA
jgi:hypothetical protein